MDYGSCDCHGEAVVSLLDKCSGTPCALGSFSFLINQKVCIQYIQLDLKRRTKNGEGQRFHRLSRNSVR